MAGTVSSDNMNIVALPSDISYKRENFVNCSPDVSQRVIFDAHFETIEQEMSNEKHRNIIRHICRAMINLYLKDNGNGQSLGIL